MKNKSRTSISRRDFLAKGTLATAGIVFFPHIITGKNTLFSPLTREFGKCNFGVTTMGLGGQASLQWTPADVVPDKIILKAFSLGINYYDTSNLYGPSQVNFGKAFRTLNLISGISSYNEKLRESIFLTSKTHLRWSKGGNIPREGVMNWTNGDISGGAVGDIKRSLSQIFGDGKGNYPEGAYLNMVLIHNLNTLQEVDALYEGVENTDPGLEYIGALAALRDYKDGTNLTGLNPGEEKLIRHIGFSGHFSPGVMMEMIRRDKTNILDAMLVAISANGLTDADRRDVEKSTAKVKEGKTNYFQDKKKELSAPGDPKLIQTMKGDSREVTVSWNSAYAGDEPLKKYEIWRDNKLIGSMDYKPQISLDPFRYSDHLTDKSPHEYKLVAVDALSRKAETDKLLVESIN